MKTINGLIIVYLIALVIGTGGYVLNIIKLCKCDFRHPVKAEVVRAIGVVVPPVGAVTGFINIKDGI